jgi:beta-N-acetylhexosaminidase
MTPVRQAATPAPTPVVSASQPTSHQVAEQILAGMSLEQKVGQVFMLGFEGTTLTPANRALIHDLHLGGVTLFARNVEHAQQLARLDADLQTIADPVPLFVSVDQEGGLVVRVTEGATIFPGNMAVGATGDSSLARRLAEAEADELLAMGVNMNLAPVVDVNTNPLNPVIGVRAFGSDPALVSQFGVATIDGFQQAGVSAVGKHFPGHGDTAVDSHLDLPLVPHPLERLDSIEFQPFRAAIQAGVDGVMTAHVYLPAVEPKPQRPATLSHAVLTGLLRERLGYTGLILTDALDMGAIKRDRPAADAAVEAFEAGADMLLVAGITREDRAHLGEGPPALLAAVKSGRISQQRLGASVLRILEAKARRGILSPQPAARPIDEQAHRELALEVARKAITLQRDDAHLMPLRAEQRVLVVVPDAPTRSEVQDDHLASSLLDAVRQFAPNATGASASNAVEKARPADVVVLGTYDLAQDPAQQALAQSLIATGKPVVGVALRGPYDPAFLPTILAAYGDRPVHLQAAAEALFGQLTPAGKAP